MLGIGIGLSLMGNPAATSGGGGAAWTPATSTTAPKAYYDASDMSTLFQTSDTSTPVTGNGQTVKRINDKSGNNLHLTTAANIGWIYNNGKLTMAGSSELFQNTGNVAWTDGSGQITLGAALNFSSNTGTQGVVSRTNIGDNWLENAAGVSKVNCNKVGGGSFVNDTGPAITTGTGIALTGKITTAGAEAFVNGATDGSNAGAGTPDPTADQLHIGFGCNGTFSALAIFPAVLGTSDLAGLNTWLQARA